MWLVQFWMCLRWQIKFGRWAFEKNTWNSFFFFFPGTFRIYVLVFRPCFVFGSLFGYVNTGQKINVYLEIRGSQREALWSWHLEMPTTLVYMSQTKHANLCRYGNQDETKWRATMFLRSDGCKKNPSNNENDYTKTILRKFGIWMFPKSWGYPKSSSILFRVFHEKHSNSWGTPFHVV